MPDNDARFGEPETVSDEDLGETILRCRPLPPMQWVSAQGFGVLGAYLAMPLVILPFFAMIPAALALVLLVPNGPQAANIAVFTTCFFAVYVPLAWLVYLHPRGDHLVLHTHGFQVKITFKLRRVLFRQLRSISIGKDAGLSGPLGVFVRAFQPGHAAMIEELARAAMNLHYQDGSTTVFKQFMHRFEPEDLDKFFGYIAQHQAQLIPSAELSEKKAGRRWPSAPFVAFVIACLAVIAYWAVLEFDTPPPVATTFAVEADAPTLKRLKIRQGQWLDLSLVVNAGTPVDVYIVPDVGHVFADRPEVTQVREFQRKMQWQNSEPAVVVVTTTWKSEVSLQAKVTRHP